MFLNFWPIFHNFSLKRSQIALNFTSSLPLISLFGQFSWDCWGMFRILWIHDLNVDDSFEFLASEMWVWANVTHFSHQMSTDEGGARSAPPSSPTATYEAKSMKYSLKITSHSPKIRNIRVFQKRANTKFETFVKNVSQASKNSKHSLFSNS